MSNIAIIYFSGSGSTHLLAEAVAAGARAGGAEAQLLRIGGDQIQDGRWSHEPTLAALNAADAIVFGTPTYMGGPAAQFKAFADATGHLWYGRTWRGKLAGGFTMSSSLSGDKLNTLMYLAVLAAQHGMTWLNWGELPRQPDGTNHLGSFLGLMGANDAAPDSPPALSAADALSARKYGEHLARMAARLRHGDVMDEAVAEAV